MGESKAQEVDLAAIGHGALDLLGFIPGIGAAADVANGLWYAAEGNYVDAAMSFVSAVPGVGDAAGAAKVGPEGRDDLSERFRCCSGGTEAIEKADLLCERGVCQFGK